MRSTQSHRRQISRAKKATRETPAAGTTLIDLLSVLLVSDESPDEKVSRLENQFGIPMARELKGKVTEMCNASVGIVDRAVDKAMEIAEAKAMEIAETKAMEIAETKAEAKYKPRLAEADRELSEANRKLGEADRELGDANRKLGEADRKLGEANKTIADNSKTIAALEAEIRRLRESRD